MKNILAILLLFCFSFNTKAQISPPGLGKGKLAVWGAVGINQNIAKNWQSNSYLGLGRISTQNDNNPLKHQAIVVINQEFYHQFHKNWETSIAASYRIQDDYSNQFPFNHLKPPYHQEIRLYSRLSYKFNIERFKITPTIRQEFRKYYDPRFHHTSEDFQFRTRFRVQFSVSLDKETKHRIAINSEQIMGISKLYAPNSWTNFAYKKSRFSIYYTYAPLKTPIKISIGYMNNLIGTKKISSVSYVGVDIIFNNIFGRK